MKREDHAHRDPSVPEIERLAVVRRETSIERLRTLAGAAENRKDGRIRSECTRRAPQRKERLTLHAVELHIAPFFGVLFKSHRQPGAIDIAHLPTKRRRRSEEHTSELQSRSDLVCRLLLEKK